jgi:hypothetical protein
MKYDVWKVRGFWLPDSPLMQGSVTFKDVLVAKGDWDGEEDEDDEQIFFYMDGMELHRGDIISDGFVVIEIED